MAIAASLSPESRVRWALRFIGLDLDRLSDSRRREVLSVLWTWQSGKPDVAPTVVGYVPEAQTTLRECIEALVNREPTVVYFPETSWGIFPPARRRVGRRSSQVTRQIAHYVPPRVVPEAIVFAFIDDLNAIGADRLRACPLERDGARCGVVFLGVRRQRFCSREHANAAAWQTYSRSAKRKLSRR
jgi:hypothetical protein